MYPGQIRRRMNIVALYKTFSCNEFVEASVESIYPFVDKIVFVNSSIDWCGRHGINEVEPVVRGWQKENDKDKKIAHIQCNTSNQYLQTNVGYTWARSVFKPQWFLSIDTDEVWDKENMQRLAAYSKRYVEHNAIHVNMHTYVKSPFYRVKPVENCRPCVLFRPVHPQLRGIRGNQTGAGVLPRDLFMSHYSYVRRDEKDVFRKIWTTLQGDRDDNPHCQLVDMDNWIENKWNKLPDATDFHTTATYEWSWHSIEVVGMNEVPETLRDKPIIKQYIGTSRDVQNMVSKINGAVVTSGIFNGMRG